MKAGDPVHVQIVLPSLKISGGIREALNDTLHESLLRQQTTEQLERVQLGHEAILAALEQGDAEAAGRVMAAHFDEAVVSLLDSATGDTNF